MQSPDPDTSEYAALMEHIGGSVRLPACTPDVESDAGFTWAARAKAMTQTLWAVAAASTRPPA